MCLQWMMNLHVILILCTYIIWVDIIKTAVLLPPQIILHDTHVYTRTNLDASTHRRKYQKLSLRKPKLCLCLILWHGTHCSYVIPFPQHLCTVQKITKLPLIKTIISLTLGIWSMGLYLIYCTLLKLFFGGQNKWFLCEFDGAAECSINIMVSPTLTLLLLT